MTKRPTPINADTLNTWIAKRGRQYRGELERLLALDLEYGILDMPDLVFQAFMRRIQGNAETFPPTS